ncbi:hypothetical protein, partial [Salmonella enterica]|uniref:hypothetical protein n=1 Tax=Salmonella enterica TaxID=28901 RepID=UPI001F36D6AC
PSTNGQKVVADITRRNRKNILLFIKSPVTPQLALALALAIDVVYAQHSSHFTVIGLIIKFVERKFN